MVGPFFVPGIGSANPHVSRKFPAKENKTSFLCCIENKALHLDMQNEINIHTMSNETTLNQNEQLVLNDIRTQAMNSTGGDFTYFSDVMKHTQIGKFLTSQQVKGYLSILQQKSFLKVENGKGDNQIFDIKY